ncbi:HAMP domain-containing sensor histidine kinase [Paenibacillus spongiae]|uniref:histidine kinase n=1 Tax=Paenibacillus spongiae TaxID=2909671 RepID=A0ABY5SIM8_9BACL|nr:cell wall metabolism sensor histidine kinase WalK [Paenibacillus spongiae]UVI32355.1 cell wall metabolism sensor histidine kinase WalK [Paenibacillus spongiae]
MIWRSVVGKLWITIILLVAVVLIMLGMFLLQYIDIAFTNSHQVKVLFVYTGIIGFLLSTFFAFFLSTKITQPLIQMKTAADLIAQGEYRTRVPIRSTDEIGDLANTFNHMASELDTLIKDLNHEKDHLSSVLRSMADAVITLDANGQVILANPPGQQLLKRWNELEWTEDSMEQPSRDASQVPEPLYELYRTILQDGRDMTDKVHVQSAVWSVVMAPLKSDDTIRGAVAVMRNVTEESKLEKLRSDFVANVSHEIRTPLSMLQGYSEALLDDIAASPEERKELVQVIHDESLRMGRLVKDLLDLARMEAGHIELRYDQVNLTALMKRVHRKFLVYAKERGIELIINLPESDLYLQAGDEDRLEQVLTNLLDNALRHTRSGAAIKIAAQYGSVGGKTFAELKIQDEGQGIPQEDLPYIFERFYKADKARTRGASSGGTGLGLAIVKNIIEAHRGRIDVMSVVGKGTTFTMLLPVEAQ